MWLPQSLSAVQAIQKQLKNPLENWSCRLTFSFCDWQWTLVGKTPSNLCQQTLSILVSFLQLNQRGRLPGAQPIHWATQSLWTANFKIWFSFWNILVLVNERRKSLLFLPFPFFMTCLSWYSFCLLISTLELSLLGSTHNQRRNKAPFKRCRPLPIIAVGVHNINQPEPFTRHTSFPLT